MTIQQQCTRRINRAILLDAACLVVARVDPEGWLVPSLFGRPRCGFKALQAEVFQLIIRKKRKY
jgi:hypothetical protein